MKYYIVIIMLLLTHILQAYDGARLHAGNGSSYCQATVAGAWTAVSFDHELWDTRSYHSNVVNLTRITIKNSGLYNIHANLQLEDLSVDYWIAIFVNGVDIITTDVDLTVSGGQFLRQTTSTTYYLNSGDYIELYVFNDNGMQIYSGTEYTPVLSITRVE